MSKFLVDEIVEITCSKHLYGYVEIECGNLVQVLLPISDNRYLVYCDYLDWMFTVNEDEIKKVDNGT